MNPRAAANGKAQPMAPLPVPPSDSGHANGLVTVELVGAHDLTAAHRRAWQKLADHALDPNVFYEPAFALAALEHLPGMASVRLGFVWHGAAEDGMLCAVIPIELQRRWPLCCRAAVGWRHPFAVLTNPLLAPGSEEMALGAFLDHLAHLRGTPRYVIWPLLADANAAAQAISQFAKALGRQTFVVSGSQRAVLNCHQAVGFLEGITAKRRKEMRRQRRRLAESGDVAHLTATDGEELERAVEEFLGLEALGWKGRAGTAARQDKGTAAFLRAAVMGLSEVSKTRVDSLLVCGRLVASTVTLRSGTSGSLWKIAHDEAHASQAPGIQLLWDVSEALASDRSFTAIDSCAVEGHRVIESLWADRLSLADRLVFVRAGEARMVVRLCIASERVRRHLREQARKIYDIGRSTLRRLVGTRASRRATPASTPPLKRGADR